MFMQMPPKPRFRDLFKQDLTGNLMRLSQNGTVQLYRHHLMTECVMYACDMCLEFQRKSEGLLTFDWIEHIVTEVSEALKMILPKDFTDADNAIAIEKVKQLMQFPGNQLQDQIDRYYHRK